jgi:arsenite transporter
MSTKVIASKSKVETKEDIAFFEKYLTVWVLLCILIGIGVGYLVPESMEVISLWSISTVNIPVAVLVWMMVFPMMAQIDFSAMGNWKTHHKGLALTVTINWLVKPFTMAIFAWIFFEYLYAAWLSPDQGREYLAGAILLGAAPCTAMVFVWSYLSGGNPNYTLIQVAFNDLILLFAFVPIVSFLLGISEIAIPYDALLVSVTVFVVFPLLSGYLVNRLLIKKKGEQWYKEVFLTSLKPVSVLALLVTLVLLFAFQGQSLMDKPFHILLIAIPLALQTYFIFFLSWFMGKKIKLSYSINAPSAMIGASNFFELAVAVAIVLFGLHSGAALATVVGVLIEVPVMLSLVAFAKKGKYN